MGTRPRRRGSNLITCTIKAQVLEHTTDHVCSRNKYSGVRVSAGHAAINDNGLKCMDMLTLQLLDIELHKAK